ncbi:MAG: lipoprotein-releasing ABC transporter permease subunit [Pseudomonadota bacterium]|nr:lipoprotein-releasing ABC transporter permease subunit [Pseudomonadota bacterium]
MMAIRYLRARRKEGLISVIAWFSLLGIALGVATLIIVMAVMNGFRQELLTRILGINGHLSIQGQTNQIHHFENIKERIAKVKGVRAVIPLIEGQVMVTARGIAQGAVVRGIRSKDLKKRKILKNNIKSGTLDSFVGQSSIILGHRLAENLGIKIGDKITLISPKGNSTAFGTMPRIRAYKLVATFHIGMYEYDSNFIFMPLETAQKFFKLPNSINNLDIFVNNPDDAIPIGHIIKKTLGKGMRIHDWQHANASFFNAIQVERNVMFLILTLIILVAAFNIISSLIMLVKDKGKDIAILRTIGLTRGAIMKIFFLAGALVGTIGTLTGFAIGIAFTSNIESIRQWIQGLTGTDLFAAEIYFLSQLPAVVDTHEVIAVVLMGLGLSFLATLYPAWRAAKIDPADALRYE